MGEEVKVESEGAPNGVVPDGSPGEDSMAPSGDGKDGEKDRGRKDRERERSYRDRDRDRRRDSRERDRDRERIRDKDRYRDRNRHRDYDHDYDRRRKDRDRRRDRSRSRSPRRRRRRSRSASYSRSRSRDRYRHRRYRDRRSRSPSRGGKRRRSRSKGRSPDRYRRSRDERRGSPGGGADFDPSKQFRDEEEEKRLAAEKEVAEMERDLRTIFIWQLSQKVRERDVFDLFSKAGKVRDVRLIIDRRTGRHKGAGYVEFYYKEAIPKAMELNGQAIRGFPVAVKPSEAEKNIAAEMAAKDAAAVGAAASATATATATADAKELNQADLATVASMAKPTPGAQGFTKLYVGSVHFSVSEDDLRTIFSPYGDLASLQLHRDADTGRSKGFGFIQYSKHESAQKALEQLNGLELAGRALRVGLASTEALRLGTTAAAMSGGQLNPTTGEQPGEGATAGSVPTVLTTADRDGLNELDDGQDRGLALTANQRAQLMQKLSRGEEIAPSAPAAADAAAQGAAITAPGMVATLPGYNPPLTVSRAPSRCLMLRNMFDPQEETEPDFHMQVAEDVRDECLEKFGPLKHLIVDKNSAGIVYLKFDQLPHAVAAKASLSGRFFAGKQVIAEFIAEPIYQQRFADVQD